MSRDAEAGHDGRTGALARRARLAPLPPALLAVVALLVPALAEASVPRPGAFASLGDDALAGASRHAVSLRSLRHELAPSALAVPERESGFVLFAGGELAHALGQGGHAGVSRFALELGVQDLALAPLALASRARDAGFHPLLGLSLIDTGPLRGPPDYDQNPRRGLDYDGTSSLPGLDYDGADSLPGFELDGPESRIGVSGLFLGTRIGAEAKLTLNLQWGCDLSGCELALDQRKDPLGLMSEEEFQTRYYADVPNMSAYAAAARDQARRALSAYQDELQSERKSILGHLWADVTGRGKAAVNAWTQAPANVQAAVQDAWRYRPDRPLDPDQIAAGGDYGRKTAIQLGETTGEIQGKGAAVATRGGQMYFEGKAFELALSGVPAVIKRGPKPKGTGPHNLKIEEVAKKIQQEGHGTIIAGGGIKPEVEIEISNGYKGSRRPDILVQRADGTIYGVNVGKTERRTALPVKRERQAIEDLEGAGIEMHFVPYDR